MKDREILRELICRYAEAANAPRNREAMEVGRNVNDLKSSRPAVLLGEIPWHELNENGELTLQCQDPYWHPLEEMLRRTLFQNRYFPGDMMIAPYLWVDKKIHSTGIGVEIQEEIRVTDQKNGIVSHKYQNLIQREEDLEKLHPPVISYDEAGTMEDFYRLADLAADLLPVKIRGAATGYGLGCTNWDTISQLMDIDTMLLRMLDEPELMHALVQKLTDLFLSEMRQYEEMNLLDGDALYIHETPTLSQDLASEPMDRQHVKLKNVWGRGLAQILSTVSPAMHQEFDIAYMKKAMEPFGLVYYGCCEPLDRKIKILEEIPHLRKISISPWADVNVAAEVIGNRYVASVKPNPAFVAGPNPDFDVIRKDLENSIRACRKNNTPFELVLKDISTVSYRPDTLVKWEQLAMSLAKNMD